MRYLKLRFAFEATENIVFPDNPVNTFRGALGYKLKQLECVQQNDMYLEAKCKDCSANVQCAYALCYETSKSHLSNDFQYSGSDLPHMMVIDAEFNGNEPISAGETFAFVVSLFGIAVSSAKNLISAVQTAGKLGLTNAKIPCELKKITHASTNELVWAIDQDSFRIPETSELKISAPDLSMSSNCELTINFASPVAFKDIETGKITTKPDFGRIVGSLMRRYSVFEASEGNTIDWDFGKIARFAAQVQTKLIEAEPIYWERYSTRQKRRIPISGIKGRAKYVGPIKPFIELINAGETLRCGRSVTFGQGRIEIEQIRLRESDIE
ncbi:MAG: CRISPR system precrRNA processing endoribonuclease RAMP protein Cas6 [Candidatus Riflebacteria bacterium]|nr:CRISPR system precrRNA processing endoribonuclease RAMP protein Cas6 [Candidatus Riflebacteria bacterium]